MADLRLPNLNKCIISGRIANDLELKYTPKGTPVLRFTLAVDRNYKDESDQWQKITSWIDCVAWNRWAENLANYSHKGSALIVEGRIETRSWTDQNNVNRKSTELVTEAIHNLEWKPRDGQNTGSEDAPLPDEITAPPKTTNDDLPF
ncbi:MAG: single-stranded DNA-binding protein [Candidatus Cloacimonetes bacterium]|jgi:single-strand DNA-binding protein|nr:single-stranded DNA-binding protein [Candidatus Cloacimonadota bacterium]MDY0337196.1 single-stranded DNA-binding protein [Candidatus Cloacimonadaceae bacterium]MCB5268782.1 single-stranded DNA-binding protein [Candidatus Cloacimonadota bacterium]MCK9334055.1 single-stranded DNA-binding protein [Candidatus Cloacimonadota bacterium]MDD2543647.1 single-stranded DNA-binding protein [Candidatus Cloacimonadota bacterium]